MYNPVLVNVPEKINIFQSMLVPNNSMALMTKSITEKKLR